MKTKQHSILFVFLIISVLVCCTENYELTTANFENLLVVEATLTDEMGPQVIKLSRTIPLNTNQPIYLGNAQVRVEDSDLNIFEFTDSGMGTYISTSNFQTIEGQTYVLHVTTPDGANYVSSSEIAPVTSEI